MSSVLGRNVVSCSKQYQLLVNYLLSEQFKMMTIYKIYTFWISPHYYAHTMSVLEFIMLKRQVIFSPQVYFAPSDINNCISDICTV